MTQQSHMGVRPTGPQVPRSPAGGSSGLAWAGHRAQRQVAAAEPSRSKSPNNDQKHPKLVHLGIGTPPSPGIVPKGTPKTASTSALSLRCKDAGNPGIRAKRVRLQVFLEGTTASPGAAEVQETSGRRN